MDVGHERVHHEHHVGARLGGEVGVTAEPDAAVDVVTAADRVRIEEAGDRGGRRHRLADRYVPQLAGAEDDALGRVEVDGRDEQRSGPLGEGVGEAARGEGRTQVGLQRVEREEAGRHVALGTREHVWDGAPAADGALAEGPDQPAEASARAAEGVAGEDGVATKVDRVVEVLFEDLIDVAGADATGQERGDHGSGAAADVNVEAMTGAVQPLLKRGERSDLVHAADDAATGQSQGVTRPRSGPPSPEGSMYELHPVKQGSKGPANHGLEV